MLWRQHQAVWYILVDMIEMKSEKLIGLLNIRTWDGLYLEILLVHGIVIAQSKWTTRFTFLADGEQRKIFHFFEQEYNTFFKLYWNLGECWRYDQSRLSRNNIEQTWRPWIQLETTWRNYPYQSRPMQHLKSLKIIYYDYLLDWTALAKLLFQTLLWLSYTEHNQIYPNINCIELFKYWILIIWNI